MQNSKRAYRIKIFKTLTRVLPSLFWVVLIFGFDSPSVAFLTVCCAGIHECGHVLLSRAVSRNFSLRALAFGFGLKPHGNLPYTHELLIASGGPLINLALFALTVPFRNSLGGYVFLFGMINLLTALSNLMPLRGYDGYRIAECIISKYGRAELAASVLPKISFATLSLSVLFSLYLMEKLNTGYWIFFILIFSLIRDIKRDGRVFLRENGRKLEYL